MGRLAVAEEGLVVDPRLQALEVEPARGLVATIVIAIERHLVEARVVIGIPSMSGLPELVRAVVQDNVEFCSSRDAQESGDRRDRPGFRKRAHAYIHLPIRLA